MILELRKLIKQQFINFLVYVSVGLIYGLYINSESLTYILPIFVFSCLLFIASTLLIYGCQRIFKKMNLIIYLIPQLIGLSILIFILISNRNIGYIIGYGIDGILWGFQLFSTLLNIRTYFAYKNDFTPL